MEHPDKRSLAAFIENTLPQDKRDRVDAHLKDCEQCKSALAEYAASMVEVEPTVVPLKKSSNLTWILSIAAILVIGVALFFFFQARESKKDAAKSSSSSPANEAYLTSSGVKKKIEGKTFLLTEKTWVDEAYNASGKPSVMEFQKNTQAYKDLIAAKPTLKAYAEAGPTVIVLFENQGYKFTP